MVLKKKGMFVFIFLLSISLIVAQPVLNFVTPTPDDYTQTIDKFVEIKTDITEASLQEIIYNWNYN